MEVTGEEHQQEQNTSTGNIRDLPIIKEEDIVQDELCLDNKDCNGCEEENPAELNAEINSSFEEVFRDPRTFDFLQNIGKLNPLCDLRKESLYVKFDPYVPPLDDSTQDSGHPQFSLTKASGFRQFSPAQNLGLPHFSSTQDSLSSQFSELNNPAEITESINVNKEENILNIEDEVSHEFSKIEIKFPSVENIVPEECSKTLFEIPKTDPSGDGLDNPDRKLSIEIIDAMKGNILHLRNLIVKRELEHREKLNEHKKMLQQEKIKSAKPKLENPSLKIVVSEYEEFIKVLTLEKRKTELYFEEMKKKLQDDLASAKKEKSYTDKAYDQMVRDDDNLQKKAKLLKDEKLNLEQQIEQFAHLCSEQEKNIQAKKWEFQSKIESLSKENEATLQKNNVELSLINNHKKTLELKEISLKVQLERMIRDNKSIENMIAELMKNRQSL